MIKNIYSSFNNDKWLLLLIWAVLLAFNLNKAFHIDDAFHLEAAQWIAQHPLTPMSGRIIWQDEPEQLVISNQPPLYFYGLAAVGSLFGFTEIPLHLFQSLFVFGALWYFYRIAQLLRPENARLLLLLFGFCPAFMVNQNLMADVVLLMFALGATYFLLKPTETDRQFRRNALLAALYIGISLLVKYSQLPFLVVIVLYLIYIKRYTLIWVILLPLTLLAGWSAMNLWEFGQIHLATRPSNPLEFVRILNKTLGFLACLGAIAPFGVLLIGERLSAEWRNRLLYGWAAYWLLLAAGAAAGILQKAPLDIAITVIGLLNGGGLLGLCIVQLRDAHRRRIEPATFLLLMWLGGVLGFLCLFAPFVATRHVLLVMPPILLLLMPRTRIAEGLSKYFAIGSTLLLGVLLAYSDWCYADFYRQMARTVPLPQRAAVWNVGHWGWQWYIRERNTQAYGGKFTPMCVGDYIIYPKALNRQVIDPAITHEEVAHFTRPASWRTFVYVSDKAALYSSSIAKAAWTFSRKPIDTLVLHRVTAIDTLKLAKP